MVDNPPILSRNRTKPMIAKAKMTITSMVQSLRYTYNTINVMAIGKRKTLKGMRIHFKTRPFVTLIE